jgi:hypothetical protein
MPRRILFQLTSTMSFHGMTFLYRPSFSFPFRHCIRITLKVLIIPFLEIQLPEHISKTYVATMVWLQRSPPLADLQKFPTTREACHA